MVISPTRPYGSGIYGEGVYPGDSSILVGRRAQGYHSSPRFWRSDIYRTKLEDVTPVKFTRAVFSYNEDYATKRTASLSVRNPDALEDLQDWIVAETTITADDGSSFLYPLGHYLITGRDVLQTNAGRTGTLACEDITWLISQATMDIQYVVPVGVDKSLAAREIIIQLGIPETMINIPASGKLTTEPMVGIPGDRWWRLIVDLLAGALMYQPWVALDGRITSRPVIDIRTAAPNGTYRMETGAKILPGVRNRPDRSRLKNRITVRKVTPGEPLIEYTATVTDQTSRIHPDNLGQLLGNNKPVIWGETYEESGIETEEDARILAEARLSEAGSFLDRLNMSTYLDSTLDGHQVLDINIRDNGSDYHSGNWLQRTFDIELQGAKALAHREFTRTVGWR